MKIASWNVNSVKVRLPHLLDFLKNAQPDVLCLQEIKCLADDFPRLEMATLGYKVEALGQPGDILFLITTSGGDRSNGASMNLVHAAEAALARGMRPWLEICGFGSAHDAATAPTYRIQAEGATAAIEPPVAMAKTTARSDQPDISSIAALAIARVPSGVLVMPLS